MIWFWRLRAWWRWRRRKTGLIDCVTTTSSAHGLDAAEADRIKAWQAHFK